ncbi:MAG: hydrogenase, partial [Planctomycetaceae bacterium]
MASVSIQDIDNTNIDPAIRPGVVTGENSLGSITDQVASLAEKPTATRAWKIAFAISVSATLMFFSLIVYLLVA